MSEKGRRMDRRSIRMGWAILAFFFLVGLFPPSIVQAGPNKEAKDAYGRGDFELSVRALVSELRKKPDHQDNIALMELVLPLAFQKKLADAKQAESANDWDGAYRSYQEIISLNQQIATLPPLMKETKVDGKKQKVPTTFQQTDVSGVFENSKKNAIDAHYSKALECQKNNNFKNAAVEFRLTRQYDPNYKDAASNYETCRAKAMIKIAIMPFENKSGKTQLDPISEMISEQIISKAMNSEPEFLQFVDRNYLTQLMSEQGTGQSGIVDETTAAKVGKIVGVNAFVFGKVINSTQNYSPDKTQRGRCNATRHDYSTKQDIPIYADWESHAFEGKVTLIASYKVIAVQTGLISASETVTEIAEDAVGWIKYSGDEYALSSEVKALSTTGQRALKNEDELLMECGDFLSSKLAQAMTSSFK